MVGIVGGIGSGKSRVASLLAERGAQVLDADAIGHVLLNQSPSREQVIARFGEGVIDQTTPPDAPIAIDRKSLGAIVFADEAARKALEAILHPRMRMTFEKAISRAARRRQIPALILDAAVLYEAGWHDLCDVVVFVDAPEEIRQARLTESRGWSPEVLSVRQAAQMPLDTKRSRSDFVVENAGDEAALETAVASLWEKLVHKPAPPRTKRSDPGTS